MLEMNRRPRRRVSIPDPDTAPDTWPDSVPRVRGYIRDDQSLTTLRVSGLLRVYLGGVAPGAALVRRLTLDSL